MSKPYNIAFIDGQNLHLGTKIDHRQIDLNKFRIYLRDKFQVQEAYYFLGFVSEEEQDLYSALQKAGFICVFREHSSALKGQKKGNVDVDVVFEIMRRIYCDDDFDQIVMVSGDGDYIKLIRHLIKMNKLKKILFPNKNYSSLYKPYVSAYSMTLGTSQIQKKIAYKKRVS